MAPEKKPYPEWFPYLCPYLLFLVLTVIAAEVPGALHFAYPVKTAVVAAAVIFFWRRGEYPELELRPSFAAIAVGLLGFALWVLPEKALDWLPKQGGSSYDPHAAGETFFVPLAACRIAGAVLLVPIFEELFLRSFLHRYLDAWEEFRSVPIGRYRLISFVGVVVAMMLTHHRWLRAGAYSALITLLLYRDKRMGSVIWAHAVTNLALGVYVLVTGEWDFW